MCGRCSTYAYVVLLYKRDHKQLNRMSFFPVCRFCLIKWNGFAFKIRSTYARYAAIHFPLLLCVLYWHRCVCVCICFWLCTIQKCVSNFAVESLREMVRTPYQKHCSENEKLHHHIVVQTSPSSSSTSRWKRCINVKYPLRVIINSKCDSLQMSEHCTNKNSSFCFVLSLCRKIAVFT